MLLVSLCCSVLICKFDIATIHAYAIFISQISSQLVNRDLAPNGQLLNLATPSSATEFSGSISKA